VQRSYNRINFGCVSMCQSLYITSTWLSHSRKFSLECLSAFMNASTTSNHCLFIMRLVTRTISATVGRAKASRFAAYGIGTSAPQIRSGGASRSSCVKITHVIRMTHLNMTYFCRLTVNDTERHMVMCNISGECVRMPPRWRWQWSQHQSLTGASPPLWIPLYGSSSLSLR